MQYLRVPADRIGALLGRKGDVKKKLESETGVIITIDSVEGEVEVDGSRAPDPVMELKVMSFVNAIGRGFSPDRARKLLLEDNFLDTIRISDYVGGRKNRLQRMRGRLIGKAGKSRKTLEELTETYLSIQGDTIGIIGDPVEIELAKSGIDMLLRGSEHSAVFHFLEHKRRELKLKELMYTTEPEWPDGQRGS